MAPHRRGNRLQVETGPDSLGMTGHRRACSLIIEGYQAVPG